MIPNKKGLYSCVSFFLVLVTIACSCGSFIPSGGSTPSIPPVSGSTQEATGTVAPTATATMALSVPAFIEQVANQTDVPAGESGSAIAACPSDSLMLGGGFASAAGIKITKTMPDPSGWLVAGLNSTAYVLSLTAYAYCLHNAAGITRVASADVLVSGFPRTKCESGEILTGGGYAFTADSMEVYMSTPDGETIPNAWSVMAHSNQSADQTISVYAVCLANSSLTGTLVRDQTNFAPGTGLLSFTLVCPAGNVMSVGGYEGTGAYISRINSTEAGIWEVQVQGKIYSDGSLDHAVCLNLP